ncbi:MAG: type II secretion system protein [Phycisphaerales bacterium]
MNRSCRRGFTLIEAVTVMVLLGIISAVLSTVIYAATDTYSTAQSQRQTSDQLSFAIDFIARSLREVPASETNPGSCGILDASDSSVRFESGLEIELLDGSVWISIPQRENSPLIDGVTDLRFAFFPDGAPDQPPIDVAGGESAEFARVIDVLISAGGQSLRTRVLLRSMYGGGA